MATTAILSNFLLEESGTTTSITMAEENKQAEEREVALTQTTFKGEDLLKSKTAEELQALKEEVMAKAEAWSHYTEIKDEVRADDASFYGGFELRDY